jgi:hypothetical protein
MPNEEAHLKAANHNQAVIALLLPRLDDFSDWVTTVAFYKALHVIEAVFANDPNIRHGIGHEHRERVLKTTPKYMNLYKFYRPLYSASIKARYLDDPACNFAKILTPADVRNTILGHYLRQVEKSARTFLKQPNLLQSVDSLLKP